jgi:hypothetical protein
MAELPRNGNYEALAELFFTGVCTVPVVPARPDEDLERRINLLPLFDPLLTNRTALFRNLCFIPANHAALCGRKEITETDRRAQSACPFWPRIRKRRGSHPLPIPGSHRGFAVRSFPPQANSRRPRL